MLVLRVKSWALGCTAAELENKILGGRFPERSTSPSNTTKSTHTIYPPTLRRVKVEKGPFHSVDEGAGGGVFFVPGLDHFMKDTKHDTD